MTASPHEKTGRWLRRGLFGWIVLDVLGAIFVGTGNNLAISDVIGVAGVLVILTLFAALISYLVLRLMDLL